jgi:hypothetical protein
MFLIPFMRLEAAPLRAIPCTLVWKVCFGPSVTGYAIYYGIKDSTTTNRLDVGMTNRAILKCLYASTNYFFQAAAYNACGIESARSAAIYYTPPALAALKAVSLTNGSVKISFLAATNAACHIEYSSTLTPPHWQTLGSAVADANGNVTISDLLTGKPPRRFYRAAVP